MTTLRAEAGSFEQSDMDEYTLTVCVEHPELDELALVFRQGSAHELWQMLDRTIGEHYREGTRLAAEHQRERDIEADLDADRDAYPPGDPKHPDYLHDADMIRDRQKEAR